MSIKALAIAVLQGNRQGNQQETKSFLSRKPRQPKTHPGKPEPEWQHDACTAHAEFNGCKGNCPNSLDNCLLTKVIESEGNIDNLRGQEIGQGISTDMVLDTWLNSGEPASDIYKNPAWFICMAEHIKKDKTPTLSQGE